MRLAIQNRTSQSAILNFLWPDGTRGSCQIAPGAESYIPLDNGTGTSSLLAFFNAALRSILDQLAVHGLRSAAVADAYNATRNPLGPPWKGIAYRVDGSP